MWEESGDPQRTHTGKESKWESHSFTAADTQLEGHFLEKLKADQHNNVICRWPFAGVISV